MIIDAHAHLWKKQNGIVDGKPVYDVGRGRSYFGGEIKQMMPAYMTDGENNIERFLANMDYAQVSGAVITQEYIDGNQDCYLLEAKAKYSDRIKICALYEEKEMLDISEFDGIKICAGRLTDKNLLNHLHPFEMADKYGKFISVDLADGDEQCQMIEEIIKMFPDLRIAIGHFGMVTRDGWLEQIKLARHKNVFIESGGITWLFNSEFYPYPSAVDAINEAAGIVGFDKLMWGSDYPRTMTAITYKMSYDFIWKSENISEENKRLFLGENAVKFYGFENLTVPEKIKNMVED
jgi:predicted TIM-barrel fold metal-dependent hydrolase